MTDRGATPFCPLAEPRSCPDEPVREALPDLSGGVLYLAPRARAATWLRAGDTSAARLLGRRQDLSLLDLEVVEGSPTLLYDYTVETDEMGAALRRVMLRDLATGREQIVAEYGAFEGGLISASLSDDLVAITLQGSSDQGLARFYDLEGREVEPPHPPVAHRLGLGDFWMSSLAPNGKVFATAPWGSRAVPADVVTLLDLRSGALAEIELDLSGEPFAGASGIDLVGRRALVTRWSGPPLLILPSGELRPVRGVPRSVWKPVRPPAPGCSSRVSDDEGGTWCMPLGGVRFWRSGSG
ncbi:MAG TPA: hypothetical protein VFT27_11465 [Actinomycetota bacterium]|nr:hypothetical protein [Actinomycetota bacterium]